MVQNDPEVCGRNHYQRKNQTGQSIRPGFLRLTPVPFIRNTLADHAPGVQNTQGQIDTQGRKSHPPTIILCKCLHVPIPGKGSKTSSILCHQKIPIQSLPGCETRKIYRIELCMFDSKSRTSLDQHGGWSSRTLADIYCGQFPRNRKIPQLTEERNAARQFTSRTGCIKR